jgi:hypothetical protein
MCFINLADLFWRWNRGMMKVAFLIGGGFSPMWSTDKIFEYVAAMADEFVAKGAICIWAYQSIWGEMRRVVEMLEPLLKMGAAVFVVFA